MNNIEFLMITYNLKFSESIWKNWRSVEKLPNAFNGFCILISTHQRISKWVDCSVQIRFQKILKLIIIIKCYSYWCVLFLSMLQSATENESIRNFKVKPWNRSEPIFQNGRHWCDNNLINFAWQLKKAKLLYFNYDLNKQLKH